MDRSLENRLSDLYVANFACLTEGWPAYVNNRRREALESLALAGIPGSKDENYRHFDLRTFLGRVTRLAGQSDSGAAEGIIALEDAHRIVLDNGFCQTGDLRTVSGGAVYGSLRAAATGMAEIVEKYLDKAAGYADDSPTALCRAFSPDGAFIYVPGGCVVNFPLHVDIRYGSSGQGTACFPRLLIVLEEGASAEVVVTHSDGGPCGVVGGYLRETVVGDNARLEVIEATSMRPDSMLISCNHSVQGASSKTTTTAAWLRGGATRINAVTALEGRDCDSTLYGLYMATGQELCDVNMKVLHNVPDCRSNEVVKGIVSGRATGSFTGMVYVAQDAQRTAALQQSRNLQLSDASRIFTEPQLEIYADDVKCSHGATVGQLNEKEVYYMRQRGIGEQDAKKLQLQGFVDDVISHCSSGQACQAVTRLAEARIGEL